jgi:hypothetical protein
MRQPITFGLTVRLAEGQLERKVSSTSVPEDPQRNTRPVAEYSRVPALATKVVADGCPLVAGAR